MHLSGSAVYTLSRSGHPDITTPQNIGHRGGGLGVGVWEGWWCAKGWVGILLYVCDQAVIGTQVTPPPLPPGKMALFHSLSQKK